MLGISGFRNSIVYLILYIHKERGENHFYVHSIQVKQYKSTKIWITRPVKCMKNWNMIGFIIFTYHMCSSYDYWANLLFILWFSLIFRCLKAGSVPWTTVEFAVPDLTTRDSEHCWWFLLYNKIRDSLFSWHFFWLHWSSFVDSSGVCFYSVLQLFFCYFCGENVSP